MPATDVFGNPLPDPPAPFEPEPDEAPRASPTSAAIHELADAVAHVADAAPAAIEPAQGGPDALAGPIPESLPSEHDQAVALIADLEGVFYRLHGFLSRSDVESAKVAALQGEQIAVYLKGVL